MKTVNSLFPFQLTEHATRDLAAAVTARLIPAHAAAARNGHQETCCLKTVINILMS